MTAAWTFLMRLLKWLGRITALVVFGVTVTVLLLWLAGKFTSKVPVTNVEGQTKAADFRGRLARAYLKPVPLSESAVGTIRAVHETSIGSKLLARVVAVNLKAGQKVKAGEVLVRLDDSDLLAKLQQAKAAVTSLQATRAQAVREAKRAAELLPQRAISGQDNERALTAVQSADAEILRKRNRKRSPGHAGLGHYPLSHRRHGHRQEG